jgi:hypothetical protein
VPNPPPPLEVYNGLLLQLKDSYAVALEAKDEALKSQERVIQHLQCASARHAAEAASNYGKTEATFVSSIAFDFACLSRFQNNHQLNKGNQQLTSTDKACITWDRVREGLQSQPVLQAALRQLHVAIPFKDEALLHVDMHELFKLVSEPRHDPLGKQPKRFVTRKNALEEGYYIGGAPLTNEQVVALTLCFIDLTKERKLYFNRLLVLDQEDTLCCHIRGATVFLTRTKPPPTSSAD